MTHPIWSLLAVPAAFASLLAFGCSGGVGQPVAPKADRELPSCLAPVEAVFTVPTREWERQVATVPSETPRSWVPVQYDGAAGTTLPFSPWVTDQWVFGVQHGRPVILDFPGDRGLSEWGHQYGQANGITVLSVGIKREFPDSRFDAGGNVLAVPEASAPARTAAILTSRQIQPEIKRLLRTFAPGGRLLELDTEWLKVGHVDELVAFLPGDQHHPFRILLPDPEGGLKLLQPLPPDQPLFNRGAMLTGVVTAAGARFLEDRQADFSGRPWRGVRLLSGNRAGVVARVSQSAGTRLLIDYCWEPAAASPVEAAMILRHQPCEGMPVWGDFPEVGSRFAVFEEPLHWLDAAGQAVPATVTVGELRNDPTLVALSTAVAKRIYGAGGVAETLKTALGLADETFVRIPVLLRGGADGQQVSTLLPNPVNVVCFGRTVVLLKPFGPTGTGGGDVFEQAWTQLFRSLHLTAVMLDGWDTVHRLDGGAHCAINARRRLQALPPATDATSVLPPIR